ncbi:MAG TPA: molybdopterin cofactor-binding domain-containing protein [Allosphingosinicella sp.]|uniref:xanthine dehydrogenase family protein molybdopterin-binding subunit n=1 Tax=Allosphingosinicella sp. TaxID=2823234 RepID=UPI002EDA3066
MTEASLSWTRRHFLQATTLAGTGLAFTWARSAQAFSEVSETLYQLQPGPWLVIDTNGKVSLTVRKAEMGQGIHAALATMVAGELDIVPSAIEVRQASSDPKYGEIQTGGSFSVAGNWLPTRRAAATLRTMLVEAAAKLWKVSPEECRTEAGMVIHAPSNRSAAYKSLVRAASQIPIPSEESLQMKPGEHFAPLGQQGPARHHQGIVSGAPVYGADVRIDGMVYASIERAPAMGMKVRGYSDANARSIPGYLGCVLIEGNAWPSLDHVRAGVAVIARDTWTAQKAREQIKVDWASDGSRAESAVAVRAMVAALDLPGLVCREQGDLSKPSEGDLRRISADFTTSYLSHAQLEPLSATARVTGDVIEVWTGTQRQRRLHDAVVRELGFANDKVLVYTPLLGGSFGRRLEVDYGLEAAILAKKLGRPVQILWTRADDFRAGLFRSASAHRLQGHVDSFGRIVGLTHKVVAESVFKQQLPDQLGANGYDWSIGTPLSTFFYDVPNLRLEHRTIKPTIPCAWWRGTYTTAVQPIAECFMDELAAAAGQDPLDFRLAHLTPGRTSVYQIAEGNEAPFKTDLMRRVLTTVASQAGWFGRHGRSTSLGLAAGFYDCPDTYSAAIVSMTNVNGIAKVDRITIAVDCGVLVDPRGAEAQVLSNALFALGAALWQQIEIEGGIVRQRTYADFPVPRLADTPQIDIIFVDSDRSPSGLGEAITATVIGAIGNAHTSLTGNPTRNFPILPQQMT